MRMVTVMCQFQVLLVIATSVSMGGFWRFLLAEKILLKYICSKTTLVIGPTLHVREVDNDTSLLLF